jgi:hypothetical protein
MVLAWAAVLAIVAHPTLDLRIMGCGHCRRLVRHQPFFYPALAATSVRSAAVLCDELRGCGAAFLQGPMWMGGQRGSDPVAGHPFATLVVAWSDTAAARRGQSDCSDLLMSASGIRLRAHTGGVGA